tara:strand:+ start:34835 stop:35080 length:246 start_codon:yes stop_codon:yes gene_type:complete
MQCADKPDGKTISLSAQAILFKAIPLGLLWQWQRTLLQQESSYVMTSLQQAVYRATGRSPELDYSTRKYCFARELARARPS